MENLETAARIVDDKQGVKGFFFTPENLLQLEADWQKVSEKAFNWGFLAGSVAQILLLCILYLLMRIVRSAT